MGTYHAFGTKSPLRFCIWKLYGHLPRLWHKVTATVLHMEIVWALTTPLAQSHHYGFAYGNCMGTYHAFGTKSPLRFCIWKLYGHLPVVILFSDSLYVMQYSIWSCVDSECGCGSASLHEWLLHFLVKCFFMLQV